VTKPQLHTLAEWEVLAPFQQGYVHYMEADWPGSELRGIHCPYTIGTREHEQYKRGEHRAVLAAQDSEE